jgi:hypothetical protein
MNVNRMIEFNAVKCWQSMRATFDPGYYGMTWVDDIRESAIHFRTRNTEKFNESREAYQGYGDADKQAFLNHLTIMNWRDNEVEGMPEQRVIGLCEFCENYLVDHRWIIDPNDDAWIDGGSDCDGMCMLPPVELLRLVRQPNYMVNTA